MSFSAPYYFPNLTRESAEEILREKESGSYLLRKSSKQNQYALSIAHHNNIIHSLICWDANTNLYCMENGLTSECETPIAVCQYLIDNQESQLFYPVETKQLSVESKNFKISNSAEYSGENVGYDLIPLPNKEFSGEVSERHFENINRFAQFDLGTQSHNIQPNVASFENDAYSSITECQLPPRPFRISSNEADENIDWSVESDWSEITSSEDEAAISSSNSGNNELGKESDYEDSEWFHGQITGEEAFKRLSKNFKKHSLNGMFLVRSKSASDFVLDLISNGTHFKYEIFQNSQTKLFELRGSSLQQPSLTQLVNCLQKESTDVTGILCQLKLPCLEPKKRKKIKKFLPAHFVKPKKLRLKGVIGTGNFGEVRKGSWKRGPNDSVDVAVKILQAKQKDQKAKINNELRKEAKIMKGLDHPNIVKMLGIHDGKHGLRLMLEYMERGSLVNYLRANATCGLSGRNILRIVLEIAYGMIYLAKNKIVHRDLAARNVLLDANLCAKIADFGMARFTQEGMYVQYDPKEGPLKWYAPECLEHAEYTTKSDVWSFGVTMWETFSYGEEPYIGQGFDVLLTSLKTGYRLKQPKDCRNEIYFNMKDCWVIKPTERPNFSTLYSNLHKIFGENYSY